MSIIAELHVYVCAYVYVCLYDVSYFSDIMGRLQGSVVDAAIATILCQCVENSHSCGIGGGHFMTVYNRYT